MNRKFRESTYIQIIFLIYILRYGLELNFFGVNSYLPDIQYLLNNDMLLLTSIAIVSAHFVTKFYHKCIIHDVYDQCNAYHIKLGSPFLSLLAFTSIDIQMQNTSSIITLQRMIKKMPVLFKYLNDSFKNNYKFLYDIRRYEGVSVFRYAHPDMVRDAIQRRVILLGDVSDELRADKVFVAMAVQVDSQNFLTASDELRADKDFVLAVIEKNPRALEFTNFRADREVVMAAVTSNGSVLQYASDELRADREVVMAAVTSNGSALQYASDELRADKDFVLAVIKKNPSALKFTNFRADREVVEAVLAIDGMALEFVSKDLRADEEIVKIALKQNPDSIKWSMCPTLGLKFLIDKYEKNQVTVEDIVANIVAFTEKDIFKRHYKTNLDFLSDLVESRFKNKSDFDVLAKKLFAALDIDITIENMYKLLPQEDFSLFEYIYNIHLRDLFENREVYPSDEDKIIDEIGDEGYANDYMKDISDMRNAFPACYATREMAFHFVKGHYPLHCSKKGRDDQIKYGSKHPYKNNEKLQHDDIVVMEDQKLKCCNQALIYGFKMHTLDVLYAKDPNSPLIKTLLTTFNEEEKTKSAYKQWVRSFEVLSPISVSMFGNESEEAASTDIDLNKGV